MAKFCPECGYLINDPNAQFCAKCGARFPNNSSSVSSPVPQSKPAQQLHPSQVTTYESAEKKRPLTYYIKTVCVGAVILGIIFALIAIVVSNSSTNHGSSLTVTPSPTISEKTTDISNGDKTTNLANGATTILMDNNYKESVKIFYNQSSGMIEGQVTNLGDKAITTETEMYAVDWGGVQYDPWTVDWGSTSDLPIYPEESRTSDMLKLDYLIGDNQKAKKGNITLYVTFGDQEVTWIISP